jgi:4-hydroxy-tetrahydrodipicolinate synthase
MTTTLAGSFPVLPTPFRDDGTIDEDDFRSVVDFAIRAGSDGVVYPGVASEVETLSAEERTPQVRLLAQCIAGRIPIIVGASDPDPAAARRHIALAAEIGAAAAMVIAPFAFGNDIAKHTAYFTEVASGAGVPIMLQNQPKPVGAGLTPEEAAAIANAVPMVQYIKEETPPCGQHLTRMQAVLDGGVKAIFGGAGGRYITDELARGAAGTMPASELADIHAALVHAWQAGHTATARKLYSASLPLLNFQAVFRMHMTKEVLRRRGVLRHVFVRAKGPSLDAGDRRELDLLLAEAQLPYALNAPV